MFLLTFLQLHEQQRQAVDEPDDVGPAAVEIAAHPQLPHAEEMVVLGVIEIEHPQALSHPLALVVAEGDLHAVAASERISRDWWRPGSGWRTVAVICRTASS